MIIAGKNPREKENMTSTMTLRVVELFAGIGAQAQALKNLGLDFTSTVCEIDEKAYRSYCAIHGDTPNLGDITKVEHLPECDLLTYSPPCQDMSVAGSQRGMEQGSGTRSSLLWDVGRLLSDAKERGRGPDVLLMENVDAILNKKNIAEFNRWIEFLTNLGYTSSYKVLNAKDFGVPQNRKRCFMVSSLGERRFIFPEGIPFDRRLRDVLDDDVDESFYLSDDTVAKYKAHEISPSSIRYPCATAKGYMDAHEGDGLVMNRPTKARGTVQKERVPTLTTGNGCGTGVVDKGLRIRYLTPRECWRLMGFPDSAYEGARDVPTSKTQLYKQAGNSIVVPCLETIFKAIYIDHSWHQ